MKNTLTLILIAGALIHIGCDKKQPPARKSKSYEVSAFSHVKVIGLTKVDILKSAAPLVSAEMLESDFAHLNIRVQNDTLFAHITAEPAIRLNGSLRVEMPVLQSAYLQGEGTGVINGFENENRLEIKVAGNMAIMAKLRITDLKVEASENSRINLKGEGNILRAIVSQKGIIESLLYPVKFSNAFAENQGKIFTDVAHTLNAGAIDQAVVYYKGNPLNRMTTELNQGKVIDIQ